MKMHVRNVGRADNAEIFLFRARVEKSGDEMFPSKLRRIKDAGALPGRKPGSFARSWNDFVTLSVSASTASAGIEISSSCLQPSTNAKRIYLREKKVHEQDIRGVVRLRSRLGPAANYFAKASSMARTRSS
jgi:hypothetical protein